MATDMQSSDGAAALTEGDNFEKMLATHAAVVRANVKLAEANAALVQTNARLVEMTSRQAEEIAELKRRLADVEHQKKAGNGTANSGDPPQEAESVVAEVNVVRHCFELMKDYAEKEKKAHNLVILGAQEGVTAQETTLTDKAVVEKLMSACDVPPENLADVFRHGMKKGERPRPLKIAFRNTHAPQQILQTLRVKKLFPVVLPAHSRIRRDLTTAEQIAERDARRDAFRRNDEAGLFAWRVTDDFAVVPVKQTRPWKAVARRTTV